MTKAERRRKVFLEVRSVWGEESGQVRDRSQVSQFVARHKSRLEQVIRESNEASVIDTVFNFVREGILDSELRAKLTFPELFHPSPELHKNSLENDLDGQLQDIAVRRGELDQEEEKAKSAIRQQDTENTDRIQRDTFGFNRSPGSR